jgi:hypothetical protein
MSTIVTDTITGKSTATTITIGSTPVVSASANSMTIRGEGSNQTSIQQGLAKAWADLDGTGTAHYDDSFNFASVTDKATGSYDLFYTNNMASANYSSPMSTSGDSFIARSNEGRAATKVHVQTINLSDSATDDSSISISAHGDLS